ncbi:hypothetical protein OF83DRAFT_1106768 [Amylostereum chailletii]|nr:hypothetical protein OF83DRAFT_1106768 [Amylostereum chailletii]
MEDQESRRSKRVWDLAASPAQPPRIFRFLPPSKVAPFPQPLLPHPASTISSVFIWVYVFDSNLKVLPLGPSRNKSY